MQRVLVTGGAGFIGSHTVDLLLKENKEVIVLDNLSSGKLTDLDLSHPNLEFIEGDILEFPLLIDLLKSCDAVLHLAAISSVQYSIENPIYTLQVNTQGLLHVLQAVLSVKRPIRLVYASSAAVYGDCTDLPCKETMPASILLSPYALQKKHGEDYAVLYQQLFSLGSLGLRYFNVYGDRQDPQSPYSGVMTFFMECYKKGESLTIFGDGLQSRDFIHVADVAKANLLALDAGYCGILNIATGKAHTLLQLIEYIEKAGKHPVQYQHAAARPGDIRASYAATELAQEKLKFSATLSLEEGIRALV